MSGARARWGRSSPAPLCALQQEGGGRDGRRDGPSGPWWAAGLAAPSRVSSRALSLPPSRPKMVAASSRIWRPTGPSGPAGSGAAASLPAPPAPGAACPCGPQGALPVQCGRAAGFALRVNLGHLRAVCATRRAEGRSPAHRPGCCRGAAPPLLPRGCPWWVRVGAPGLG